MKRWIGLCSLVLALSVGIVAVGCKKKDKAPIAPEPAPVVAANTATMTPTTSATTTQTVAPSATHTATLTTTSSDTATATATLPPHTATSTDTAPPAHTATSTATLPPADTHTATPSATVGCVDNGTPWGFESCVEGWSDHPGDGTLDAGVVTSWVSAGHGGADGAVNASVPFTAQNQSEMIRYDFAVPQNLTGKMIRAWVWMDAGISDGWPAAMLFVQSGAGWTYEGMSWSNATLGGWKQITFQPTWSGGDATDVKRIGVKFDLGASGAVFATGNIKVDDVEIVDAPLTATPTVTHTPGGSACTLVLNGCESLSAQGSWISPDGNATRNIVDSGTAPVGAITEGTHCLQANITTGATWNQFLALEGFKPFWLDSYVTVLADVYADASVITGSQHQLMLRGDSCSASEYGRSSITSTTPSLEAGAQTIAWTVSFPAGNMKEGYPVSRLYFTLNSDTAAGMGNVYIDNVRVVYNCATPPTYPVWHFETTGSQGAYGLDFTPGGAVASWLSGGYGSSLGCFNASIPFSATGETANIQLTTNCFVSGFLPIDLTGRSLRARVWMDSSIAGDGTPEGSLFIQSTGAWTWEGGGYTALAKDDWTLVEWTPATSNMAEIVRLGVQVNMKSDGTTRATGNIRVDDIEIY